MSTDNVRLYIGNLSKSIEESVLREFLEEYGKPTQLTLFKNQRNSDTCFAICEFETYQEASDIIQNLNYSKFDDLPIRICWFNKNRDWRANIVIKNLDPSIDDYQLYDAISEYGEILSCKISRTEGKSNGYGYIQFKKREDAEKAIEALNNVYIEHRLVKVEPYIPHQPKNIKDTFTNVYIKNLPNSFKNDDDVKHFFINGYNNDLEPRVEEIEDLLTNFN